MTDTQIFRISGLALLVGAIAFTAHIVARSVITAGSDPATVALEGFWVPINVLGAIGAVLVLLGLPAMYVRMTDPIGMSGLIGVVLLAFAWMFFGVFLSLYSALIAPWLADKAPALVAAGAPLPSGMLIAFIVSLLAWLAGTVLLAIPFMRGQLLPHWVGYMLIASGLWMIVGNLVIAPSGPASNLAINLLSNLGPVLLLVAIGYLGVQLWSEHTLARDVRYEKPPSSVSYPR